MSEPASAIATRLWCELAWLGGEAAEADVLIEVAGDRIAAVDARAVDAAGRRRPRPGLTSPGSPTRTRTRSSARCAGARTTATGSFWTWREQMYELAGALDPDACFELSRAAFGEMALAGITCVGEFHYLHHAPDGTPYEDPNAMGRAVLAAAREAGLRITLLDACYLHGGHRALPRPRRRAPGRARRRDRRARRRARVGAAIHSVRAVDPDAARVVAEWAAGRPLHAHVSEQPKENEDCLAAHGRTPTALLADAGALGASFTAIHATHLTDEDVALLGGAGATVCLCPTTERDLADGIGPARRLADAGAALATGTDSHAVIDPFEEARAIELDERLATGVRGAHRAADLLDAATAGGYAALGWAEGGRLAPGALADLTTLSLDVRAAGGHEPGARGGERGVRGDRRRRPRRDGGRRVRWSRDGRAHGVRRRRPLCARRSTQAV